MLTLCYWFDQKAGITFTGYFIFNRDKIWARPNKCAQNQFNDVVNSLYQHPIIKDSLDYI